jgi:hypothetical protein
MENRGLLFIPDISGFTRFVNETEINHSRLIIQELLEILIDANQVGLEVSEIEGDAILFYKFGEAPGLEELYKQVEKMFCAFHSNLAAYEARRFCQCKACISAIHLTLKVITHYGEFTGYNVQHFNKLIGKDIIVAHQLLKNDIEQHEYWLVTTSLLHNNPPAGFAEWMTWNISAKQTENGAVPFHYTQLSQLKNNIQPEPVPPLDLSQKVKMISITKEYHTGIIELFHATGDFNYRGRWLHGVKAVEEVNHFLPRVGMKCRALMENGQSTIYSSSYSYSPEKIEFSETDETNRSTSNYTLEKTGNNTTKLTFDYYIEKNILNVLKFSLLYKKEKEDTFHKSLQNLVELVKEIKLPASV